MQHVIRFGRITTVANCPDNSALSCVGYTQTHGQTYPTVLKALRCPVTGSGGISRVIVEADLTGPLVTTIKPSITVEEKPETDPGVRGYHHVCPMRGSNESDRLRRWLTGTPFIATQQWDGTDTTDSHIVVGGTNLDLSNESIRCLLTREAANRMAAPSTPFQRLLHPVSIGNNFIFSGVTEQQGERQLLRAITNEDVEVVAVEPFGSEEMRAFTPLQMIIARKNNRFWTLLFLQNNLDNDHPLAWVTIELTTGAISGEIQYLHLSHYMLRDLNLTDVFVCTGRDGKDDTLYALGERGGTPLIANLTWEILP